MQTLTQKRQRLERLVEIGVSQAQNRLNAYSVKVAFFALLGYAVIFGLLILLVVLVTGLIGAAIQYDLLFALLIDNMWVGLAIVACLLLSYFIARALWIRIEPPYGYELHPPDYPELFNELKLLSKILRSPPIHRVIITPNNHASMTQTPRLGIFGWPVNTLSLGLELLICMSPQQARSIIVHELSHLSSKHWRFSGWVYRLRSFWHVVSQGLKQQNNISARIMGRFFEWYAPTFMAYSFAVARMNESGADQLAAKLTSVEDAGSALIKSKIFRNLLEEYYWKPFLKEAEDVNQPAYLPYQQMLNFVRDFHFDPAEVSAAIDREMAIKTGLEDTHLALKERLGALKYQPGVLDPVNKSAARLWFGKKLPDVVKDFDNQWLRNNAVKWRDRFHQAQKGRAKIQQIKKKELHQLNHQELWELATLTEAYGSGEDCLPLYERYVTKKTQDADAFFAIGRILLDRDREEGVGIMKLATEIQPQLKIDACGRIREFFRKRHDNMSAKFWQEQLERQLDIDKAAEKERTSVSTNDQFLKPDRKIDPDALFTHRIENIKGLKHAWLAEKRVRLYQEVKIYILVVDTGIFANKTRIEQMVAGQLNPGLSYMIVHKNGEYKDIAKQVIKAGMLLF